MMAPNYDKKVPESENKYMKKAGAHIGRNFVQITIKMRTIVRIIQIMQILLSGQHSIYTIRNKLGRKS